jgi:hypothetical protein
MRDVREESAERRNALRAMQEDQHRIDAALHKDEKRAETQLESLHEVRA